MAITKQGTKNKTIKARVTEHQFRKLQAYAESKGVTMSHVLHEYIRRLPNSSES